MRGKLRATDAVQWAQQGCEEATRDALPMLDGRSSQADVYRAAYARGYREALADLKRHGIIVPEYR